MQTNATAQPSDRVTVGNAIGALVAADAPALRELVLAACDLRDEGMRALCDALPRNSHIRTLVVSHNGVTGRFAARALLRAVRANASLRSLLADEDGATRPLAAVQLVRNRAALAGDDDGAADTFFRAEGFGGWE